MIGQIISHYSVLEKLGGGGMGVVYKAEDTRLRRTVALKFLPPEFTTDANSKKRFVREAQAASALDHANICNIHEIGETADGQLFICMAFYEGETLKKKIARGPLPVEQVLDIGIQIACGLAKAHSQQIVHRDIKPANVMITKDNEIKVVDFGLAKLAGTTKVTKTGTTIGTVAYMSPEQTRSETVDERSDIFSLGSVLYELLTGHIPFAGDSEAAVVYRIVSQDPNPLRAYRSDLPVELQRIISKALHKKIEGRYQSMEDLQHDLERVQAGLSPVFARRVSSYTFRRLRLLAGIAAAAALLLSAIPQSRRAITGMFQARSPEQYIAVLPFTNVGNSTSNQAFCDGLMETLTSQISLFDQTHGSVFVVPASEVRTRGVTSPSEARRVFGVNFVVSGGVQRFNGRFRVTLNLIDVSRADSPRQMSSDVIDEYMANVAVLQDETALKMADMLGVPLQPETRDLLASGGTANSEAYEFYLNGRGFLQRYEDEKNIDQAIQAFKRSIVLDSLYALAYAGLGDAYLKKFNKTMDPQWVAQAVKNGKRAVEIDKQLTPARVTLAMIFRETGEYEKAIAELENVLALDPTNAVACQEMAITYDAAGMLDEAESTYLKSIQLRPHYWGCYYSLGVFYWYNDRPQEAVAQFQRVIELTPDNMWGYNSLGAAYYSLERLDEAREMFERSIETQPNYRAYSNLATLDYRNGRYDEAAVMYEKALEIKSSSYMTWGNYANACYWQPERREESYTHYRKAAEMAEDRKRINPRDARLLIRLAGYYAMIGEDDRAREHTREALALAPDNSRVVYSAGFTYEQLGEREKAIQFIGKAMTLGYSVEEIEGDPWLQDLRSDDAFQKLLSDVRSRKDASN